MLHVIEVTIGDLFISLRYRNTVFVPFLFLNFNASSILWLTNADGSKTDNNKTAVSICRKGLPSVLKLRNKNQV